MVRISERTSEIRTHAHGGSGRIGVKDQDERQSTAPLTPTRPLREPARSFCLTAEEAVIHGAQFHLAWVGKAGEGLEGCRVAGSTRQEPSRGVYDPTHRAKNAR